MEKNIKWFIVVFLFLSTLVPERSLRCAEVSSGTDISDGKKRIRVEQLYIAYQKDFPHVKDIQPAEVAYLLTRQKVVVIDVRTQAEMRVSMLPGAIAMDEYLEKIDGYKGFIAVAYCTIGYRSGMFAEKMRVKGVEVKNLAGGILGWVFEGGRVYKDTREVKRIHVYGPKWDYPPTGYESIVFSIFERLF